MGTNICRQSLTSICNKCNTIQNSADACTSSSSTNNRSNKKGCSYYCNTGCNTTCVSIQNLCSVNSQYIKSYVGNFPISSIKGYADSGYGKEDIIKNKWTADNWNLAISQLEKAENIGGLVTQGAGPSANTVSPNEVIKATTFNNLRNKIYHFVVGTSCSTVKGLSTNNQPSEADVITAAKANALRSAYQNAKFNTSVCDICNAAGNQNSGNASCGCNCTCACSCSCGCPSCGGCSCPVCGGCSCPVCGGCSCANPAPASGSGGAK